MAILLKDATICDLLPDFLRKEPWVQALALAIKDVFVDMLEKADRTTTYSNIDNLSDELLDILAIELQTPNYTQSYGTATKRSLIKNTLAFHYIAGSVKSTKEMIRAIFGGSATIKEWFEDGYDTETQGHGEPGHFKVDILGEGGEIILTKNLDTFRVLIESIKRKSSVLDTLTVHIEPFIVHEGMAAALITSEKKKLGVPEGEPPNPNFVPTISNDELTLFMLEKNDFSGVQMEDNNNSDLYDIELVISPESEIAEEIIITSGTQTADLILSRNADDTIEFKTVEAIARINAAGELIISEGKNYTYKIEGRCLIAIPKEEGMPTLNVGRVKPQHKGAWSINTEYDEMDIVSYNGHSYWVLQKVKGVPPADDGVNYALMI